MRVSVCVYACMCVLRCSLALALDSHVRGTPLSGLCGRDWPWPCETCYNSEGQPCLTERIVQVEADNIYDPNNRILIVPTQLPSEKRKGDPTNKCP